MKFLLGIAAVLVLLAMRVIPWNKTHPHGYKVGDCLQIDQPGRDRWESKMPIERVQEVGIHSYRTCWISGKNLVTDGTKYFSDWFILHSMACPTDLTKACSGL